ncbi:hypothetical protein FDG2_6064 [Candidatus Protofrankia californiensis]|uniref:Uncharacterized protein n=1 Tax=Candidatus Protofrankia californiensis TaxID=1839754 RepID=A0A1C3PGS3_9ACTN|nr:hypothetical protein FDG2_6064 [Candidatus Protofrankia californiensis]
MQFFGHGQEVRQFPGLQRLFHAVRLSIAARRVLDVARPMMVI